MSNHYQRNRDRHSPDWRTAERGFRQRRDAGWGMNLYRSTRSRRIAGVCAGLADHFDIAHWVVRLLWVAAVLFTGTLALWAYLGAWLLLAPRPQAQGRAGAVSGGPAGGPESGVEMEYDERNHHYRPRKVFRYSEPGPVRLRRARERLDAALRRVEAMESYVTSRQFELDREISRL
ncbi:PspC domain-containing protein [Haliea sp.]|uniref:PspC domain-containing protein n=1 Tax=Haliea sp. TaxID=1932666 RepID=UPI003528672F